MQVADRADQNCDQQKDSDAKTGQGEVVQEDITSTVVEICLEAALLMGD